MCYLFSSVSPSLFHFDMAIYRQTKNLIFCQNLIKITFTNEIQCFHLAWKSPWAVFSSVQVLESMALKIRWIKRWFCFFFIHFFLTFYFEYQALIMFKLTLSMCVFFFFWFSYSFAVNNILLYSHSFLTKWHGLFWK